MRHTTAHIGRRLHLILHNGAHVIGRLMEITDRFYTIEGHGRIPRRAVRSMSFEKKQPERGGINAVRH